jgi:C4-dicarboxylate-specific signal transduction histidine kinase
MWQHVFLIVEEGSGRTLALGTISRNITERKRSDEALRAAQAQLSHMSRVTTMGQFAASIAHEINQPLTAVVTNGNACLRWLSGAVSDLDEARAAVRRIVTEGTRAGEVIGRIRSLMKRSPTCKSTVDMNELIVEVLNLTRHEVRKYGVSLQTELDPDLPDIVGDPVQLQQVILNLLLNAIEASSSAGSSHVIITTRRAPSDQIVVAVCDSGVGIDLKNVDQLFKPFFTTKESGMGMGLSISRSCIEAHAGRLWATPNQEAGATFQFCLPAGTGA